MEYRSRSTLGGLPLVHVARGGWTDAGYQRGIATGWVAMGDIAVGVLFACGGLAFGGVTVGGVAVGLLPIGGFALGPVAVGGLAIGIVALGGTAVGWLLALGGVAVSTGSAAGAVAIAPRAAAPRWPDSLPPASIPHHPMTWSDAGLLIAIVAVVLFVVLATVRKSP
jgi:hypothetical protein